MHFQELPNVYQLDFNQRKLLLNAFITSQFYSRKQNHHINRIHERALRVVYKDHSSSFDELFEKDNSFKIHDKNLQKLIKVKMKVKMNLAIKKLKEVFEIVEFACALRNKLKLKSRSCPCKLCKLYLQRIGYMQIAN